MLYWSIDIFIYWSVNKLVIVYWLHICKLLRYNCTYLTIFYIDLLMYSYIDVWLYWCICILIYWYSNLLIKWMNEFVIFIACIYASYWIIAFISYWFIDILITIYLLMYTFTCGIISDSYWLFFTYNRYIILIAIIEQSES